ncbi:MAG: hypothetical protein H7843_10465 [Nitrospirota bacterium]
MRKRLTVRIWSILSIVAFSGFVLTSCVTTPKRGTALTDEERENAKSSCIAQYTVLGALTGAASGMAAKGKVDANAAVTGAVVGGISSFTLAWGKCIEQFSDVRVYPVASYQETKKAINYKPAQGKVMKINNFEAGPERLVLGNKLKIDCKYYIMQPEEEKETEVTTNIMVDFYNSETKKWVNVPLNINIVKTVDFGTNKLENIIDIPTGVQTGNYKITVAITALGKTDQKSKTVEFVKV